MLELDYVENPFRSELMAKRVELLDGHVTVPTSPGLGVEIDEERLTFYSKP
jgi:L-alanine-DL-glutamate epimerase-like enolase superfamily enzyme